MNFEGNVSVSLAFISLLLRNVNFPQLGWFVDKFSLPALSQNPEHLELNWIPIFCSHRWERNKSKWLLCSRNWEMRKQTKPKAMLDFPFQNRCDKLRAERWGKTHLRTILKSLSPSFNFLQLWKPTSSGGGDGEIKIPPTYIFFSEWYSPV